MSSARLLAPPLVVDPKRNYSVEEWLLIEEATGERFEYHEGRLMPVNRMQGGTGTHALIGGNLVGSLFILARAQRDVLPESSRCGVYSSDLRIMITTEKRYVYPDATVVCGEPIYDSKVPTAISNPILVAEVTSPSSDVYDHVDKFEYYSSLPTLRTYVIVSQNKPRVEVRERREGAGAGWVTTVYDGTEASVPLPALGGDLAAEDIYMLVRFE